MGFTVQNSLRGVFTYRDPVDRVYRLKRDKEIVTNVAYSEFDTFGLVGSDAVEEGFIDRFNGPSPIRAELVAAIRGLRFALATTGGKLDKVKSKFEKGEPFTIVTSYPNIARFALGGCGAQVVDLWGEDKVPLGGIETYPDQYPYKVDAIFELVRSGDSLRDNGLEIIADNLMDVDLMMVYKGEE
jgi:ATP phosphoribosyltransferase